MPSLPQILLYLGSFRAFLTDVLPPLIKVGLQATLNVDPCVIAVVVATLQPTAKDRACAVTELFQPARLVAFSTELRCLPHSFTPWFAPDPNEMSCVAHTHICREFFSIHQPRALERY